MHDNHETQKINQTSVMPEKTGVYWNSRFSIAPMYFWNDVHSTWLEAGYQRVDYDKGRDNSGWKLTLSQNISIAMGPEFRPMLRFYMTGGQVDNDRTARVNGTKEETLDDFNLGAMWEAWF